MATGVTRLNGRYATATVAGLTFDLYDWSVAIRGGVVNGEAFGDEWEVPIPLRQAFTVKARGFFNTAQTTTVLSLFNKTGDPAPIVFTGFKGTNTASGQPALFRGTCQPVGGDLAVPQAMVLQDIELRGVGAPTFIIQTNIP